MKKVLAISSVLFGVVFLAGCGQQSVNQTQTTVPVAQTKPVAQQQQAALQAVVTGKQGAVYTNVEYGFQFTMPAEWMRTLGDYQTHVNEYWVGDTKKKAPSVDFAAKATDKDWLSNQMDGFPKGYALLFGIEIIKKTDWNDLQNVCAKEDTPNCSPLRSKIGENDADIFVALSAQDGPSNFIMFDYADYSKFLNLIKSGFKLISQN